MLDLEEELSALGYGSILEARDSAGFHLVRARAAPTDERREKKRRWAREKYARERPADVRAYRRHPPGTSNNQKGDPAKRRARRQRYVRAAREEANRMAKAALEGFVNALVAREVHEAAKAICAGRFVEVRDLFEAEDPAALAARIDLVVYLRHPHRAWPIEKIAELFGVSGMRVAKWLSTREKFATI